ncbi:MAG: ROK family transcriptional regulator [Rectinemataceae bacterium]
MDERLGSNHKLVKIHNRALVLKIIQQNENISRKQIALQTGLSQATITMITNALLELGLILETGKDMSSGTQGRKQVFLSINKEKYRIIAMNLGRSLVQTAICDLAGNILHKSEQNLELFKERNFPSDRIEERVVGLIRNLMSDFGMDSQDLLGISIAAPGPLNAGNGIIRSLASGGSGQPSAAPFDWRDIHLKEAVQREFSVNAFVENDANISALGESWFGGGGGVSNLAVYMIGFGTGAGAIIDGMLYRGAEDVVAEIGHVTVNFNGPECRCGNVGCLELYSDFHNIIDDYDRRRGKAGGVPARQLPNSEAVLRIKGIFEEAAAGGAEAVEVLTAHGRVLGLGAVTLANILCPERIIISANDLGDIDLSILITQIQEAVRRRAFPSIADKVGVVASTLGRDITLYGGIVLVLQDLFLNIAE